MRYTVAHKHFFEFELVLGTAVDYRDILIAVTFAARKPRYLVRHRVEFFEDIFLFEKDNGVAFVFGKTFRSREKTSVKRGERFGHVFAYVARLVERRAASRRRGEQSVYVFRRIKIAVVTVVGINDAHGKRARVARERRNDFHLFPGEGVEAEHVHVGSGYLCRRRKRLYERFEPRGAVVFTY